MKAINDYILEQDEWNPSLSSHKNAYNSFVKWYDKTLKTLNMDEILDLLKTVMQDIEDDSLDTIK